MQHDHESPGTFDGCSKRIFTSEGTENSNFETQRPHYESKRAEAWIHATRVELKHIYVNMFQVPQDHWNRLSPRGTVALPLRCGIMASSQILLHVVLSILCKARPGCDRLRPGDLRLASLTHIFCVRFFDVGNSVVNKINLGSQTAEETGGYPEWAMGQ